VLKESLPARKIAEIGGARIGVLHDPGPALGRTDRLTHAFLDCGAVVYGHTHVPEIQRLSDRLVLNPAARPSALDSRGDDVGARDLERRGD